MCRADTHLIGDSVNGMTIRANGRIIQTSNDLHDRRAQHRRKQRMGGMQMRRNATNIALFFRFTMIFAGVIEPRRVGCLLRDRDRCQLKTFSFRALFVFLLFDCITNCLGLLLFPCLRCRHKWSLLKRVKIKFEPNSKLTGVRGSYMLLLVQCDLHVFGLMAWAPWWIDDRQAFDANFR